MNEETILRLKKNYKNLSDRQLMEMFSYGKGAYEEAAWDLIVKEAMSRNLRLPSLKTVVLTALIYVFGPLVVGGVIGGGIGFWSPLFGITMEKLEPPFETSLLNIFLCAQLFFVLIMTIILVKRYSSHLFSGSWKNNFYGNFKIGCLWSLPFIFLIGISAFNPKVRAMWLEYYLLLHELSQENITIFILILISITLLIASFLEELIFRGMIQQYIQKFVTPKMSVFITAGIFTVAHFMHIFYLPVSIGHFGGLYIGGILTGFAFNKANSCISSFIPHLVFNIKYIIIVPLMLA